MTWSYEDFEKLLYKYKDEDYIKDCKNKSTDGGVNYEIFFPKKQLAIEMKKDRSGKRIANKFKLIKQLPEKDVFLNSLKEKAGLPPNYFSRTLEAYKFNTTYITD